MKTLKGYDKNHNLKFEIKVTGWPQKAIDKMKEKINEEIKTTPVGRKIGKIEWVEVTSP